MLRTDSVLHVTKVGSGATSTASWDLPRALSVVSRRSPLADQMITGVETAAADELQRSVDLATLPLSSIAISDVLAKPQHRNAFASGKAATLLSNYAHSHQGLKTGDDNRFRRFVWELPTIDRRWRFLQTVTDRKSVV